MMAEQIREVRELGSNKAVVDWGGGGKHFSQLESGSERGIEERTPELLHGMLAHHDHQCIALQGLRSRKKRKTGKSILVGKQDEIISMANKWGRNGFHFRRSSGCATWKNGGVVISAAEPAIPYFHRHPRRPKEPPAIASLTKIGAEVSIPRATTTKVGWGL